MIKADMSIEDAVADFCRQPWDDPAPLYQRLHREAPVIKGPQGVWIVSRHGDAMSVARNQTANWSHKSNVNHVGVSADGQLRPAQLLMGSTIIDREGADHDRLRALVSRAFTPKAVGEMKGRITHIVNDLIDAAVEKGSMDVVRDFAYPLPILVIAEMLGIAQEDHSVISDSATAMVRFLDINATEDDVAYADDRSQRFSEMILRHVESRRRSPQPDLLTALVQAEEAGDRLSMQELVSTAFILAAAGHETTATLISNLVFTLLKDRRLWEALCADPALVSNAIEEGLRFETPLRVVGIRQADHDATLGRAVIPAGEPVMLWLGAANRDRNVFEEPDHFRLDRATNRHIAFSAGPHFCLGAGLARLEAGVALDALITRLPGLELSDTEARWRPIVSVRALERLPVTLPASPHQNV